MSCDLLTRLMDDDIVIEYERTVGRGNEESLRINRELEGGAVELVSINVGHFEQFLEREIQLLKRSDFQPSVAGFVIYHIRTGIKELRTHQASGLALEGALSRLRRYVCLGSTHMVNALRRRHPARSLITGLGGIGLISTNIVSSEFLSPIGAGASAGIGGALVVQSVRVITEEFLPPR
ncbi:MAG: hypothetical protein FVQ82_15620 [Planctomycetes bacterium]|nr:hypothetical protein [Planctomycetota bacterium]